jgi:hypothetical protein
VAALLEKQIQIKTCRDTHPVPCGCGCFPWRSCEGKQQSIFKRGLVVDLRVRLCSDSELMRSFWERYDAQEAGSNVFTSLVTALKRLVTEKPALLGVSLQISGVGVTSSGDGNYGLDVGGVAGIVATAASATVSGVAGLISTGAGLSVQGSSMKLQW